MKRYVANRVGPAVAVVLCGVTAWLITLVRWKSVEDVIPFVFLAVVLALGMVFGRMVGVLGSIIGAVVFAHSMYKPLGSLRVEDQAARTGIGWMLLAGVALSYLLLPSHRDRSPGSR